MIQLTLAIFFMIFAVLYGSAGFAGEKSKLGTSFYFDGSRVTGKYHNTPESTAVVEDEKELFKLLKPRDHFKDRIKMTSNRGPKNGESDE